MASPNKTWLYPPNPRKFSNLAIQYVDVDSLQKNYKLLLIYAFVGNIAHFIQEVGNTPVTIYHEPLDV
jgi:hypothetical protein